jgi:hypothetical protein
MVYLPNSRLARAQNNIFVKLHHVSLVEVHPYITESSVCGGSIKLEKQIIEETSIHSIQHSSYRIVLRRKADPLPRLSTNLRVNPSTNAKLLKTIKPNKLCQETTHMHQEGGPLPDTRSLPAP